MPARRFALSGVAVVGCAAIVAAQPLSRLKGRVVTAVDGAVAAEIHIEALYGFRGDDYAGQRNYTLKADAKGEWALIGFRPGAWAFEAWADGRVPDAIVLPINLGAAPSSGVGGDTPAWHPLLRIAPMPQGPSGDLLREAVAAARSRNRQTMTAALARLAESNDASVLSAAGRICLAARDAPSARPFFRRALSRDPELFSAALGMASSALMQKDFDTAGTEFAEARKLTTDRDERSYLSAAVADLTKLHITWKRTGP